MLATSPFLLARSCPDEGPFANLANFNTQAQGTPFTAATLVENNLSFNNGGAGVKVFETSNATIRNNTVWHNNYVLQQESPNTAEIGIAGWLLRLQRLGESDRQAARHWHRYPRGGHGATQLVQRLACKPKNVGDA